MTIFASYVARQGETLTEEYFHVNPMPATPVLETKPRGYLPEPSALLVDLARGTPYLRFTVAEPNRADRGSKPA